MCGHPTAPCSHDAARQWGYHALNRHHTCRPQGPHAWLPARRHKATTRRPPSPAHTRAHGSWHAHSLNGGGDTGSRLASMTSVAWSLSARSAHQTTAARECDLTADTAAGMHLTSVPPPRPAHQGQSARPALVEREGGVSCRRLRHRVQRAQPPELPPKPLLRGAPRSTGATGWRWPTKPVRAVPDPGAKPRCFSPFPAAAARACPDWSPGPSRAAALPQWVLQRPLLLRHARQRPRRPRCPMWRLRLVHPSGARRDLPLRRQHLLR
jgi:hypothetical protein